MSWNAPGGGGGDQNPWGNRGGQNNNGGPPDLDELFKKFTQKFSGNKGGSRGGPSFPLLGIIGLVGLAFYLWISVYVVDAQEEVVILRLGKYAETLGPGLHMYYPPFEEKILANTKRIRSYSLKAHMLTKDENIVDLSVTVQFYIRDLKNFALNISNAEDALRDATASALRHEVGSAVLDKVLTDGQEELTVSVKQRLQGILDDYKAGLNVVQVSMQRPQPPQQVQNAFDDVVRAKEDRERFINEAKAYENAVVLEAEGKAKRLLEDAEAYRVEKIERSTGEANRFNKLYTEYRKAPAVTKERLYIETLETIYSNNPKVMIDVEGGDSLLYLPIDKLIEKRQASLDRAPALHGSEKGREVNSSATSHSTSRATRFTDSSPLRGPRQ